eukprot:GHVT01077444.1.p1 GENE.GHVT01077444.1~~GHVT01077444.1.p1  ORF type:complete len:1057 (+),score=96.20 GHVT01077444.1:417-3173(+)
MNDICNPLNSDFTCLGGGPKSCGSRLQEAVEKYGCCFASTFEVLRDMVELDMAHPLVRSGVVDLAVFTSPSNSLADAGIQLATDRSVFWIEQTCQISLDRTCSQGLRRTGKSIKMKIDNMDYNKFFVEDPRGNTDKALNMFRKIVTNQLALPIADSARVRAWPGSVDLDFLIDPGWVATLDNFDAQVKERIESGRLPAAVEESMRDPSPWSSELTAEDLRYSMKNPGSPISVPKSSVVADDVNAYTPEVDLAAAPPLPPYGTFGMGRLSVTLPRASCDNDLKLDIPEGVLQEEVYGVRLTGTVHGSTREIRCLGEYLPVEGVTPQLLRCDQGLWVPSDSAEKRLVCRLSCKPYEEVDRTVLGPEYIVSGMGITSGDTRLLYCAQGFSAEPGPTNGRQTVTCNNGKWENRELKCSNAGPLDGDSRCSVQFNFLGSEHSTVAFPLEPSSDISLELSTALKSGYPPGSKPLSMYKVMCATGFTSEIKASPSGEQAAYWIACVDGVLHGIGTETIFPNGGTADLSSSLSLVEDLNRKIDSAGSLDSNPVTSPAITTLNCGKDVTPLPDSAERPISDGVLIAILFVILFVIIVMLLVCIWAIRKYRAKKRAKVAAEEAANSAHPQLEQAVSPKNTMPPVTNGNSTPPSLSTVAHSAIGYNLRTPSAVSYAMARGHREDSPQSEYPDSSYSVPRRGSDMAEYGYSRQGRGVGVSRDLSDAGSYAGEGPLGQSSRRGDDYRPAARLPPRGPPRDGSFIVASAPGDRGYPAGRHQRQPQGGERSNRTRSADYRIPPNGSSNSSLINVPGAYETDRYDRKDIRPARRGAGMAGVGPRDGASAISLASSAAARDIDRDRRSRYNYGDGHPPPEDSRARYNSSRGHMDAREYEAEVGSGLSVDEDDVHPEDSASCVAANPLAAARFAAR